MKVIRITAIFLWVLAAFSVCTVATDSRVFGFDLSKIDNAKATAGRMASHLFRRKAPYYGYALKCVKEDIIDQKAQMAAPNLQQKAKDCIRRYKDGFQNLKDTYDSWENKSRELRDALQAEK